MTQQKLRVVMKDPDTLMDAIDEYVKSGLKDLPEDEQSVLLELRREKIGNIASRWFEYGEYVVIEIDLDEKTARVLTVNETEETKGSNE